MKKNKKIVLFILAGAVVLGTSCTTATKSESSKLKEASKIVEKAEPSLETKIIEAVKKYDMETLRVLLGPIDDVRTVVGKDKLLLHMAIQARGQGMIEYLVAKKAYICQRDERGRSFERILISELEMAGTPLHQYVMGLNLGEKFKNYKKSIEEDSLDKFKEFLNFAPAVPYMLLDAAKNNSIDIVKFLIKEENIPVNSEGKDHQNALHKITASYTGKRTNKPIIKWDERMKLAEYLLEKGIDINNKTANQQMTSLAALLARPSGNPLVGTKEPFARMLIEHGSDVNAVDKRGLSVLYYAVSRQYIEITVMILDRGVDVNDKWAVKQIFGNDYAKTEKILCLFIEKGVTNPEIINTVGRVKDNEKQLEYINRLLKNGLDAKKITHFAAFMKNPAALELLEKNGGDLVNSNLILSAISQNNTKLVKYLVESKGFDLEKKYYNSGFTIMHRAVRKENKEIIKYLVSRGAKINSVDNEAGRTPLDFARGNEFRGFLRSLGAKTKKELSEEKL